MPRKSTRNAQGGGTIRQRSDGRWEGRVTLGRDPGTGKQVQKSIYGATQREVRQKMQKMLVELDEGVYVAPSKLTVKAWLETWLADYNGDVKPATIVSYRQHIKNHIVTALGAVKLSALTPSAVQRFYNDLHRNGVKTPKRDDDGKIVRVKGEVVYTTSPMSPKTVKNVHGVLHQALKQAVRLGYIRSNPTEACILPRIEKAEMRPLDAPEIKRLLASLGDDVYCTLLKVDLFTGMRQGEILGLQWSCVDFDRGTITVNKQLAHPREKGERYRLASLKNDKPRTIQPAPFVMNLLRERRRRQLQQRMLAGSLWDDAGIPDLVFTNETGRYLNYTAVWRRYKLELERAGLPSNRFHDLRHTYAVTSLRAGDDVKTVQENLGHHTAAFTLDQYGHVTESMRAASAQRMQSFINDL